MIDSEDCTSSSDDEKDHSCGKKPTTKRKAGRNMTIDQFFLSSTKSMAPKIVAIPSGSKKKKVIYSFDKTRPCLTTASLVFPLPKRPTEATVFPK